MTDWIDELKSGEATEQLAQERYWQVFPALLDRAWNNIKAQIKADAQKLNETRPGSLKGDIRVDGRDMIPQPSMLYVDNLVFPAIYLTIDCNTYGKYIKIHQLYRESFEGHGHEKDEYMNLDLDRDERLVITDQTTGRRLEDAATVSQYILSRFLNR
jgi:hypothetical protein